jgi:ABC-type glutathione transport system ATPase component
MSVADPAEGHVLALAEGATLTLARASRTALVGGGATTLLASLAAEPGAALILADHTAPLHVALGVGEQIAVALGGIRRAALDRATDLLEAAGVPDPHHRVSARPHQLSALDRQRAQLALALANAPALVLAEDPAAGLDPADTAAFATSVTRLHARLGFTLVVAADRPGTVERLVEEILLLEAGRVRERRRRVQSSASSASSASSSST